MAIVGEVLLLVRHSLIAGAGLALEQIDTVLTHPQVPGQCRRFLRERAAPGACAADGLDGRGGADGGRRPGTTGQAALGTVLAAQIYGGTVLREGVQDRDDNETRFVWLARVCESDGSEPPLRRRGRRPLQDLARVLGPRGGQPRLAGALSGRVRAPGHQPDEDRVATAARAPRAATCSSSTCSAGPTKRRSLRRLRGCERCARRCACSAPTPWRPGHRAGRRTPKRQRPRYTAALKMESTVPPESVGSVSASEHPRHGPETSPVTAMGGRVLVLNATYEPINVCTVRRAVVLLLKEKAELLERGSLGAALRERDARSPGRDPPGELRERAA